MTDPTPSPAPESPAPPPGPPPAPVPPAGSVPVARWPTALAVFLLTTVAALVIGRYVVLRVLPTREWWVAEEHPVLAIDEDTRPGQRYVEKVLFSQLSAESKVALLTRFGSTQNEDCLKKTPEKRSPDGPYQWEPDQWQMRRHIEEVAKRLSPSRYSSDGVVDRYPDLAKPLMELLTAVLADDTYPVETHARAFVLFLAMVRICSEKGSREDDPHFRSVWNPGRADLTNATPSLVRFLSSPDPRVRRMAAMAFATIGMPRRFSVMPYRDTQDVSVFPTGELIARLSDPDWLVGRWAAEALAYVPPNERHIVTPALLTAFTSDPRDSVRTTSVRSVGVIGALSAWENTGLNPDPRAVLIQFLATPARQGTSERTSRSKHSHSEDSDLRLEAVHALGRMTPTPQVTAALIQIVRDTPVESQQNIVECAAAWVLSQRPLDEPAQAALLDCVRRLWAAELIPNYVNAWKGGGTGTCYTLYTMVNALLMGNHNQKRIPQSDLIRVLPATVYPKGSEGYLRLAFSEYPFEGYTHRSLKSCEFPRDERRRRDDMFCTDTRLDRDWLQDRLERVGPPAKSDLPALRLLLDYDGAGVTTDATVIQLVRTEAARAIIRDLIYLVLDPLAVLQAVAADPTAHAVLKSVAEAKASELPRDKK